MQWLGRRESSNVDDRRGLSGGHIAAGGGIVSVVVYIIYSLLSGNGIDPAQVQQQLQPSAQTTQMTPEETAADDKRASFVKVVFADTEDVWDKVFSEKGETYPKPTLVLFRDVVESGCGNASAASGPFYCPEDSKLYIDLSFYEELQKLTNGKGGDFAMAYVVAHEVGHHIQKLNGTAAKVSRMREQMSETEFNKYSVMMELQADFLAGVWANKDQKMKNVLNASDIDEALTAANAIGDDRLQKQSTGRVVPDAFTHGTSAQRMYWFKKGYDTGDISQGDTFSSN